MMIVKGKVENGVIKVIAVVEGKVVGYQKPLYTKEVTTEVPEVQPVIEVKEEIDSPFIGMVNKKRQQDKQEEQARIADIQKRNRRRARLNQACDFMTDLTFDELFRK